MVVQEDVVQSRYFVIVYLNFLKQERQSSLFGFVLFLLLGQVQYLFLEIIIGSVGYKAAEHFDTSIVPRFLQHIEIFLPAILWDDRHGPDVIILDAVREKSGQPAVSIG